MVSLIIEQLTPREIDVAELMAQGLENAAIAERLHVAPATVHNRIAGIFSKCDFPPGTHRRVALALAIERASR